MVFRAYHRYVNKNPKRNSYTKEVIPIQDIKVGRYMAMHFEEDETFNHGKADRKSNGCPDYKSEIEQSTGVQSQ